MRVTAYVNWNAPTNDLGEPTDVAAGLRPDAVNLTLLANGVPCEDPAAEQPVMQANGWTCTWENLPRYDERNSSIQYSIQQSGLSPANYNTEVFTQEENADDGTRVMTFLLQNNYTNSWNYAIHLQWDTADASQRYEQHFPKSTSKSNYATKYILTISTNSVTYEPEQLQVRIPYTLWKYRNGTCVEPKLSLAKYPAQDATTSFHYQVEDPNHTPNDRSDDVICFTNWDRINGSINTTIVVEFPSVSAELSYDMSRAELVATGTGYATLGVGGSTSAADIQRTRAITVDIDTGAKLDLTKAGRFLDDQAQRRSRWTGETYSLDEYCFIKWYIHPNMSANQPYELHVYDTLPDQGGTIIDVSGYSPTRPEVGQEFEVRSTLEDGKTVYYVIVAYPRAEHDQHAYYYNDARATVEATDQDGYDHQLPDTLDTDTGAARGQLAYSGYHFDPRGLIYVYHKYDHIMPSYGVTALEVNRPLYGGFDFQLQLNSFRAFPSCNANGVSFDMWDSHMYWMVSHAGSTQLDWENRVPMTPEDYELYATTDTLENLTGGYPRFDGACGVEYTVFNSDRSKRLPFECNGEFLIQAQQPDGAWVQIDSFRIPRTNPDSIFSMQRQRSWHVVTSDKINGKGYVGLRVISPEGMEGSIDIQVHMPFMVKPDSPRLREWFETYGDTITQLHFLNVASFLVYGNDYQTGAAHHTQINDWERDQAMEDGSGKKVPLIHPDDEQNTPGQRGIGHQMDATQTGRIRFSGGIYKDEKRREVDTQTGLVTVRWKITASHKPDMEDLPEDVLEPNDLDVGVFYDLLPTGHTFDAAYGVHSLDEDEVEDYQVLPDFRGSGREMLIVRMRSRQPVNLEYAMEYRSATTFADINSGLSEKGVNQVVFQGGADYDDLLEMNRAVDDSDFTEEYVSGGYAYNWKVFQNVNGQNTPERKLSLRTSASCSFKLTVNSETRVDKRVMGESTVWSLQDTTFPSGQYAYKLYFEITPQTVSKDLIIYDLLERDANNADGNADAEEGWRGTLLGVDTSEAEALGCRPVVYYSTAPGLQYDTIRPKEDDVYTNNGPGNSLENTALWSTTPPANPDDITAIAIDLRTRADGSPFAYRNEGNQAMGFSLYLQMRAPDLDHFPEDVFAYNRIGYETSFRGLDVQDTSWMWHYNINTPVKIELKRKWDFSFYKFGDGYAGDPVVPDPNKVYKGTNHVTPVNFHAKFPARKPLEGVAFDLHPLICTDSSKGHTHGYNFENQYAALCYGAPIAQAKSDENGLVTFTDIPNGTYQLREAYIPDPAYDWAAGTHWTVVINRDGTVEGPDKCKFPNTCGRRPTIEKAEDGKTILVNPLATCSIVIRKEWDAYRNYGDEYRYQIDFPEEYELDVYQNDKRYMRIRMPTIGQNISSIFNTGVSVVNLPKYDENGELYVYTVKAPEEPTGWTGTPCTVKKGSIVGITITYDGRDYLIADWEILVSNRALVFSFTKSTSGVTAPKNAEFEFEMTLDTEDGQPLEKSEVFSGYAYQGFGSLKNASWEKIPVDAEENRVIRFKLKWYESIHLRGLPEGTRVHIKEVNLPPYYVSDKENNEFTAVVQYNPGKGVYYETRYVTREYMYNWYKREVIPFSIPFRAVKSVNGSDPSRISGPNSDAGRFLFELERIGNINREGMLPWNTHSDYFTKYISESIWFTNGKTFDTVEQIPIPSDLCSKPFTDSSVYNGGEYVDLFRLHEIEVGQYNGSTNVSDPSARYRASDVAWYFTVAWTDDGMGTVTPELTAIYYTTGNKFVVGPWFTQGDSTHCCASSGSYNTRGTTTITSNFTKFWEKGDGPIPEVLSFNEYGSTFDNSFCAEPVPVSFYVDKVITGDKPQGNEWFEFVVEPDENNPRHPFVDHPVAGYTLPYDAVQTTQTNSFAGEKNNAFLYAYHLYQPGTYKFRIYEKQGSNPNYTYSSDEYLITIQARLSTRSRSNMYAEVESVLCNGVPVENFGAGEQVRVWGHTYESSDYTGNINVATKIINDYHPNEVAFPVEKSFYYNNAPTKTAKTFRFQLTPVTQGAPMPASNTATVTIQAGTKYGDGSFGPIKFTQSGTYQYRIDEVNDGQKGIGYDGKPCNVKVVVNDEMNATVSYIKNGVSHSDPRFVNTYVPQKAELKLPVTKRIVGGVPQEETPFEFLITPVGEPRVTVDANPYAITMAAGQSEAQFTIPVSFDSAGEYTFTIEEVNTGNPLYAYTGAKYTVTVKVENIDDAYQVTEMHYKLLMLDRSELVFENAMQGRFALAARKRIKSPNPAGGCPQYGFTRGEWQFTLSEVSTLPDGSEEEKLLDEAQNGLYRENVDADLQQSDDPSLVQFVQMTYTKPGTHHYRMREVNTGYTHIEIYDDTVYDVVVQVDQVGNICRPTRATISKLGVPDSAVEMLLADAGRGVITTDPDLAVFENGYNPLQWRSVTKVWADGRTDPVVIELYRVHIDPDTNTPRWDFERVEGYTPTIENGKYTFSRLPLYDWDTGEVYVYFTKEVVPDGYVCESNGAVQDGYITDGGTIYNIPEAHIRVTKVWTDGSTADADLTLMRRTEDGVETAVTGVSIVRTGDVYEVTDLPATTRDGKPYTYFFVEKVPAGYALAIENVGEHASETARAYDGATLYNEPVTSVSVTKRWLDGRDDAITPVLYQRVEGEPDSRVEPMPPYVRVGQTYTFENLFVVDRETRKSRTFYVRETNVPENYIWWVENQAAYAGETVGAFDGGVICNKPVKSLHVTKRWSNDTILPITLDVYRLRDDRLVKTVTFSVETQVENKGRLTIRNLDAGEEYYVREQSADGVARTTYTNEGEYVVETDRAYEGGIIENTARSPMPQTGDPTSITLLLLLLASSITGLLAMRKRKETH